MRIGIMCHSSYGGSGRIGLESAQELARRGHRVHLFTHAVPWGRWDPEAGVTLHCLDLDRGRGPSGLYLDWPEGDRQSLTSRVLALVAAEGLDLLHFHYALPFALVAAAIKARLQDAAPLLVGTLHGTEVSVYGRHPDWGPRLSRILKGLDGLTTVSLSHARLAARVFGLSRAPAVIPNFVDLSHFRPPAANGNGGSPRLYSRNGRPRIIHVSNFRAMKDPQSLAAIFLDLRARLDAELWLVGDGPELEGTMDLLARRGAAREVRHFGLTPRVAPLLKEAHLLLMSSRTESFCLAALEAMACGVPVLAPRVGGLPEVVLDGATGFLYPRGDLSQAVDLAADLLTDPCRRLAMGRAAARHSQNFSRTRIITRYENFYYGLWARRRGPRPGNGNGCGPVRLAP